MQQQATNIPTTPVTVCWGVWSPFTAGAKPVYKLEQSMNLPMLGGPAISPDERLCFKNEFKMHTNAAQLRSSEQPRVALPTVNVAFRFALKSEVNNGRDSNCSICSYRLCHPRTAVRYHNVAIRIRLDRVCHNQFALAVPIRSARTRLTCRSRHPNQVDPICVRRSEACSKTTVDMRYELREQSLKMRKQDTGGVRALATTSIYEGDGMRAGFTDALSAQTRHVRPVQDVQIVQLSIGGDREPTVTQLISMERIAARYVQL